MYSRNKLTEEEKEILEIFDMLSPEEKEKFIRKAEALLALQNKTAADK